MQIKVTGVNAAGTMAEWNVQRNRPQVQAENNMFGPQCKVTISKEGKSLSRQQAAGEEKSARSTRAERKLFLQQEEAEQNKKSSEGYREQLEKIEKTIDSLNKSYKSEADQKTIEKEQEVLRAMREQKQAQMEENQKRAKEAKQMAMQSAKYQEEIDENNRELLTVLKSLEEAEKAGEDQGYGEVRGMKSDIDVRNGMFGTNNSTGDIIQNSAAQFMASSMERDLGVEERLAGLSDGGLQLLDQADTITRHVIQESADIRAALDDEAFTEEEKAKRMEDFQERVGKNNLEVRHSREQGLHMLQTARDYKIKRIADDPLRGMEETRKSMMQSAIDAAIGEAVQGSLDKASQELEEEVKKLIDERNDIDRKLQDEEEEDGQRVQEEEDEEKNSQNVQEEENSLRQQEKGGSPSSIQGSLAEVADEERAVMLKRS